MLRCCFPACHFASFDWKALVEHCKQCHIFDINVRHANTEAIRVSGGSLALQLTANQMVARPGMVTLVPVLMVDGGRAALATVRMPLAGNIEVSFCCTDPRTTLCCASATFASGFDTISTCSCVPVDSTYVALSVGTTWTGHVHTHWKFIDAPPPAASGSLSP